MTIIAKQTKLRNHKSFYPSTKESDPAETSALAHLRRLHAEKAIVSLVLAAPERMHTVATGAGMSIDLLTVPQYRIVYGACALAHLRGQMAVMRLACRSAESQRMGDIGPWLVELATALPPVRSALVYAVVRLRSIADALERAHKHAAYADHLLHVIAHAHEPMQILRGGV